MALSLLIELKSNLIEFFKNFNFIFISLNFVVFVKKNKVVAADIAVKF